jgi:hypothetical protein
MKRRNKKGRGDNRREEKGREIKDDKGRNQREGEG